MGAAAQQKPQQRMAVFCVGAACPDRRAGPEGPRISTGSVVARLRREGRRLFGLYGLRL
jgi:hypothetical protein